MFDAAATNSSWNAVRAKDANGYKIAGLAIPGHFKRERKLRKVEGVKQLVVNRHGESAIPRVGSVEVKLDFVSTIRSAGARFQENIAQLARPKWQTVWRKEGVFFAATRQIARADFYLIKK